MTGTKQTIPQLESAFSAAKTPSAADYANLFASFVHKDDTPSSSGSGTSASGAVSAVIMLEAWTNINGWYGGQYEPVDVESIVDSYTSANPGLGNPDIVSVANAGITAGEDPLYVRTTAKGQAYITAIPYGHAALFTKSSGDDKYYPTPTAITITEYDLSELARVYGYYSGS